MPIRNTPKTLSDYRNYVRMRMDDGGTLIARLKKTGEWKDYTSVHAVNPNGLPEATFYQPTPRLRETIRRMIKNDEVVVVRGDVEGDSMYLVAGPKWPK